MYVLGTAKNNHAVKWRNWFPKHKAMLMTLHWNYSKYLRRQKGQQGRPHSSDQSQIIISAEKWCPFGTWPVGCRQKRCQMASLRSYEHKTMEQGFEKDKVFFFFNKRKSFWSWKAWKDSFFSMLNSSSVLAGHLILLSPLTPVYVLLITLKICQITYIATNFYGQ